MSEPGMGARMMHGFKIELPHVNRIYAGFDSECNDCFTQISEGDEIGMVDDEWVCSSCCDEEDARRDAVNES